MKYEIFESCRLPDEEWRPALSLIDVYVSSRGRVYIDSKRGKPTYGIWRGWYQITIRGSCYIVARLVCSAFNGQAPDGYAVCMHLDDDPRNNKPTNLKWGTVRDNVTWRWRNHDTDV